MTSYYHLIAIITSSVMLLSQMQIAQSAEITAARTPNGNYNIVIKGPLVQGDQRRFDKIYYQTKSKSHVNFIELDSPGGIIDEGYGIGRLIQSEGSNILVGPGARCNSACFLIFISGYKKVVSKSAMIGVHRASRDGVQNDEATQRYLDLAYRLGVVEISVLKRITSAASWQMNYLSSEQLKLLNVIRIP